MTTRGIDETADRWQRARKGVRARLLLLTLLGGGAVIWANDFTERTTTQQMEQELRRDGLRG
ncbi:hypothetical protein [Deinococcus peraridilitoris]|uniref:Uncharacterized protein n=1 Tax=Deinococcus peraridilitoris (strain DSM 19664 / LMG 22246 / CIP 109416 / KR-200) TaxID=937777 RepID=K9ZXV4_DEIPD|nr:hypothetical protein [Deinococcus peraridilitoris]AFZ66024.1 hypothetical protein Deipe_0426 [Deinococcus peraridilitoris DSM 19664]